LRAKCLAQWLKQFLSPFWSIDFITYLHSNDVCSVFSKNISHKQTLSDRMMNFFQRIYAPLLEKAIRFKKVIVGVTVAVFVVSVFLFSRMGGEFIPTLQEGDFAFHCILPQGTSLSQSLETSMQASRLIKEFDEVKMVVGKTGAAEVPTDPMPPEATDMMIILKPAKRMET
jgi:cobalt-zinc-cadmium resistance protein CzcA